MTPSGVVETAGVLRSAGRFRFARAVESVPTCEEGRLDALGVTSCGSGSSRLHNACREINSFIPALAYTFAQRPTEIEVAHEERAVGESKYSLYSLIRLNFDLMTGFSVVPLQWFSLAGILIAFASLLFTLYLGLRRLMIGPESEGLFTLFGIAFFLIGVTLFGIGLLGEYIGRIYQQVRARPRYLIQAILEQPGSRDAG